MLNQGKSIRLVGFTLLALLTLSACSVTALNNAFVVAGGNASELAMNADTLDAIFATAGKYVVRSDQAATLNLYCELGEGDACYLIDAAKIEGKLAGDAALLNDQAKISRSLTRRMFVKRFIGDPWKYVEGSLNRGVKIQCAQMLDTVDAWSCRVNRGGGWRPALVLNGG